MQPNAHTTLTKRHPRESRDPSSFLLFLVPKLYLGTQLSSKLSFVRGKAQLCGQARSQMQFGGERNVRAAWAVLAYMLLLACGASAHHILGIPHYAYDERYPQTPILEYRVEMGPHEIKMTGYPGKPEPMQPCSINVYIRRLDNGEPFDDVVTLTVMRDRMIGQDPVVYGPVEARLEEAVYKLYPQFETEANYLIRIAFDAEGAPWIIDLPMVVGNPGSPWALLGGIGGGLAVFLVVLRAIRIKRKRRALLSEGGTS